MHQLGKALAASLAMAAMAPAARAACLPAVTPLSESLLTEASVPAATVTGWVPDIYFVKDRTASPDCPSDVAGCQDPRSVSPGDAVLVNKVTGDYACVTVQAPSGTQTTAWLPVWHLAVIARSVPGPDDWEGEWVAPEKSITIRLTPSGDLSLAGSATWGADDPDRMARGGPHIGEFEAKLQPAGAILSFTQGLNATLPYDKGDATDCRVQLLRRGPYLVARDDGACGGANVTFTGMYRRK